MATPIQLRMRGQGVTTKELAQSIGLSYTSTAYKLQGHIAWTVPEMWGVVQRLGIQLDELPKLFPPTMKGK